MLMHERDGRIREKKEKIREMNNEEEREGQIIKGRERKN